jgi:hypothetical protein
VIVRFLVDEDVSDVLAPGLRLREPRLDILDVKEGGLRGTPDPALLQLAWEQSRVLVTCDRRTMIKHVRARAAAGQLSSGVCIIPQRGNIGEIIDSLLLIWGASTAEEWIGRIAYIPF